MKKRFNKGVVLPLLAAIAFAGVGVGTTFALFTSEAKTTVKVGAGTVDVKAATKIVSASSTVNAKTTDATEADGVYTFENGGTAKVEDGIVTLDRMTPGDKVVLDVTPTNNSNVTIRSRLSIIKAGALAQGLDIKLKKPTEQLKLLI